MRVIGLTGGIGSGKSTVARMFVECGARLLDGDEVAREVTAPNSPVLDELAAAFGSDVMRADGSLDRALLAARAFGSAEWTAELNAITHPRIRERLRAQLAATPVSVPAVIVDLPLLARRDAGAQADAGDPWVHLDAVIVIDVPEEMQFERAVQRGMAEQDVRTRMSRQASRTERLAIADYVIDNSGTMDETRKQVHEVWDRVLTR